MLTRSLAIAIVFSTIFIACISSNNQPNKTPIDAQNRSQNTCNVVVVDSLWTTMNNNGQGNPPTHFNTQTAHAPIEHYYDNLRISDRYSVDMNKDYHLHFSQDSLSIDSVGRWGDYVVNQVSNFFVMHRSVLLMVRHHVTRILFTEFDHVGAPASVVSVFAEGDANNSHTLSLLELT
jgi:hypothetical protein